MRYVILIIIAALALVGCGESTNGDDGEEPQVAAEEDGEAVSVSGPCRAAMANYHDALVRSNREVEHGVEPSDINPDQLSLQAATLKACKSREEWLAGVEPYSDGVACIACVDPEKVLLAFCGNRTSLPACGESEIP